MVVVVKGKNTKQILCPHCTENTGKYPNMLCATDENNHIIIRCKTCKTDVDVTEILEKLNNR